MSDIKIYNCDCMELMAKYPDKYFDLSIVDPPYGIGEAAGKNRSRIKRTEKSKSLAKSKDYGVKNWDNAPMPPSFFIELNRVSKNVVIFGANHFIENIPNANSPGWIVWDKENGKSDFADCELAYTNFNKAVRKFTFRWNGLMQGDMKNKEIRIHPTQKPVALYKWILKNYAKPGFKILDTHLGSGSIAIACHELGFDLIASEIDEGHYNEAIDRFNKHISQMSIFDVLGDDSKQLQIF